MNQNESAQKSFLQVNQPVRKIDYQALVTGKPVYTADLMPSDCLVVKLLRSPHAFARVLQVHAEKAKALPGIVCVLTHQDVPAIRFTNAGQSYPEPSPYDRRILDEWVRYVGDPVAIVAGENAQVVQKALKLIKVDYEVLTPILDAGEALDHEVVIHPETDLVFPLDFVAGDAKRNLVSHAQTASGDVSAVLQDCDEVVEAVYQTQACQQAMMEPFGTYSYIDQYNRLTLVSSTQIPFHVRRIIARALDRPIQSVRVIKPRIGGGFGAKQTAVCEVYPAIVTQITGKKAGLIFTREECMMASTPRHPMRMTVRIGATKDGIIQAIDLHTLSDSGAYGEHGPTTVGLSGHKSLSLYPKVKAWRFDFDVVYTNKMASGAYRGYGATQGLFAIESAVDELAHRLGMDPAALRFKNMVEVGDDPETFEGGPINSCRLADCLKTVMERIGWTPGKLRQVLPNGHIRALGCALAMQGSGIAKLDTATTRLSLQEDGSYLLMIGATDMGTGCDTILAQMAAEALNCSVTDITVHGVDTDVSPYDKGSYASSTTYVTGNALLKTADLIRQKILDFAASTTGISAAELSLAGRYVVDCQGNRIISLAELGNAALVGSSETLMAQAAFSSPLSPPPFMAGACEIDVDPQTGMVKVVKYAAAVDCGTVINPNLARVQTEGGILQAIGMALYEKVAHSDRGVTQSNSFLQYKIPNRLDAPYIDVVYNASYEPNGPFGAKSIGELVIDTPAPAIANAIQNATGVRLRQLPMMPEDLYRQLHQDTMNEGE